MKNMCRVKWFLKTLLVFQLFHFSASVDSLTSKNSIKDGEVLVSSRKVFALGFFSPGNSVKRYIGVWFYQDPTQASVWVANRDNPLNDKSGVLSINTNGNLVLFQANKTVPVWSTNVSAPSSSSTVAQLLDNGNLILFEQNTKKLLWQGFDYPTNTMLPYMKIGLDKRKGLDRFITSWKSPDDPGTGNYSYRIDPRGFPQLSLYQGAFKFWRTGSWTGKRWTGVPEMTSQNYIHNSSFVNNQDEVSYLTGVTDPSILARIIVNETGLIQRFILSNKDHRWTGYRSYPKELCDYYGHCGPNSNCNMDLVAKYGFECTCLPGFEPKNGQVWNLRDGSDGCIRKQGMSLCQKGEGFVRVERVKLPDTSVTDVDMSLGLKECENKCLINCSCLAYTSAYADIGGGTGCITYHGDMIDTRTYANGVQDLFVRVNATELALYRKNSSLSKKEIASIAAVSFAIIFVMLALVIWLLGKKRAERARIRKILSDFATSPTHLEESGGHDKIRSTRNLELPLFDLSIIAVATNNFSSDNKLGGGGFGSVYKGILHNGQEIAVKRLSKSSAQGIEEFKNEISLIVKLQHRNLVRILGCCIEAEETMLIYEYLPNKSLDSFIFNEAKRSSLDWRKRFEIICGIARGILYLHQDSRLRIIHRDLKASNILLDEVMNPKISDFGMARIFGGNQIEANTTRVMGTYGYMSPEYAMHGLFSIKSDVYSFGILVLEIITGTKNSNFYLEDTASSNLTGHVWDLWKEGKSVEIVDKLLGEFEPYVEHKILRCIQIGLLCVQEQARDRPTMSEIISMLVNDIALPSPERPAFIGKITSNDSGNTNSEGLCSINEVTITMYQGR